MLFSRFVQWSRANKYNSAEWTARLSLALQVEVVGVLPAVARHKSLVCVALTQIFLAPAYVHETPGPYLTHKIILQMKISF